MPRLPLDREVKKLPECPAGGQFGSDLGGYRECDDCAFLEGCERKAQELKRERKVKRAEKRAKELADRKAARDLLTEALREDEVDSQLKTIIDENIQNSLRQIKVRSRTWVDQIWDVHYSGRA